MSSNPDNTEAELRKKIHMAMLKRSISAKKAGFSTVVLLGFAVDEAVKQIKKHELDARLDELKGQPTFSWVTKRIATLQKEREALDG